jgi:hypothetical protein
MSNDEIKKINLKNLSSKTNNNKKTKKDITHKNKKK